MNRTSKPLKLTKPSKIMLDWELVWVIAIREGDDQIVAIYHKFKKVCVLNARTCFNAIKRSGYKTVSAI